MKEYYLHVHSKPSPSHPNNHFLDFTVELPTQIETEGEWEIGLVQLNFTKKKRLRLTCTCVVMLWSHHFTVVKPDPS